MKKYLINIVEEYKFLDYYEEAFKNLFEEKKIKTNIFYKTPGNKPEKLENKNFLEFIKYENYSDLLKKLEEIKEQIFYINTFDEKLVLLANKLKKDLGFAFTEKYEIFRNKDLQRKFLLENFSETTVNFQNIDFSLNQEIKINFPCILKPISGVQSAGVNFIKNEEELAIFREKILDLNKKLFDRGLGENKFILEEFIDGQMYTIDYFVDENGDFFVFPIVKIELASKLSVDDFANYARFAGKIIENEISENEVKNFIEKHIKTFGIKNTFVHHEFKKTSSGLLKTIELNGRIGGYRYELYKENFGVNMFFSILDKKISLTKKDFNYAAFVFYPDKDGILEGFDEKIKESFKNLDSFLSLKIMSSKIGLEVGLTKNGFSSIANLKLVNKKIDNFQKDVDFVWKNFKDFIILKK